MPILVEILSLIMTFVLNLFIIIQSLLMLQSVLNPIYLICALAFTILGIMLLPAEMCTLVPMQIRSLKHLAILGGCFELLAKLLILLLKILNL